MSAYIVHDPVLKGYRNEPSPRPDRPGEHPRRRSCCWARPSMGRDLAGSVATTLPTGLTADHRRSPSTRPRARWRRSSDLRRPAAVHDHDAGLPAADGHRASGRVMAKAAARRHPHRHGRKETLGLVETQIVIKLLIIADEQQPGHRPCRRDRQGGGSGPEEPGELQAGVRTACSRAKSSHAALRAGRLARSSARSVRPADGAPCAYTPPASPARSSTSGHGGVGRDRRDQHRRQRPHLRLRTTASRSARLQVLPALTQALPNICRNSVGAWSPEGDVMKKPSQFDIVVGAGPSGNACAYTGQGGPEGAADRARRIPGQQERAGAIHANALSIIFDQRRRAAAGATRHRAANGCSTNSFVGTHPQRGLQQAALQPLPPSSAPSSTRSAPRCARPARC